MMYAAVRLTTYFVIIVVTIFPDTVHTTEIRGRKETGEHYNCRYKWTLKMLEDGAHIGENAASTFEDRITPLSNGKGWQKNITDSDYYYSDFKGKILSYTEMPFFLGAPDYRGAYPVFTGDLKSVCDDMFNDRTALAFCQSFSFTYGRRTTISKEQLKWGYKEKFDEFNRLGYTHLILNEILRNTLDTSTKFKCFDDIQFKSNHTESGKVIRYANIEDRCRDDETIQKHFPCAPSQKLAVFCYNDKNHYIEYHNIDINLESKWFAINFDVRYVKLGQKYDILGYKRKEAFKALLPKQKDFSAQACKKKVNVNLKVRSLDDGKYQQLVGKFPRNCNECIQIKYKGKPLLVNEFGVDWLCSYETLKNETMLKEQSRPCITEDLTKSGRFKSHAVLHEFWLHKKDGIGHDNHDQDLDYDHF